MNVKKIKEEGNALTVLATGAHPGFVNAIRRVVMNSVQSLAIENISIYRNDSVLFDEFIASRLGSLPLKTGKSLKKGDTVKLTLHEKGPKTVLSSSIKPKSPGVDVVNRNTPIVKLKAGQEIKMEMEAVMDSGKEHVKWQPAIVSYHELPEIKNKADKIRNTQKIVDSCPKKALEARAGKIVLKDPYECSLCGYCEDISAGQIELVPNPNSFVLSVESLGQKPPKEVLIEAAEALKEKTAAFQSEVSKKVKK